MRAAPNRLSDNGSIESIASIVALLNVITEGEGRVVSLRGSTKAPVQFTSVRYPLSGLPWYRLPVAERKIVKTQLKPPQSSSNEGIR